MNAEKAALSFLHTFNSDLQDEGASLRRSGGVKEIFGTYQAFQARVRGGGISYIVHLRADDERWNGECSCKDLKCEHQAAAMSEWLERSGELPENPGRVDDKSLEEVIEEKIERRLTAQESDYVAKIESRYKRWEQKTELLDHDLVRLNPRWPVESYEPLTLWPDAPDDLLEFWNYVAYAMAKKGLIYPAFLNVITDLDATRAKFRAWEREGDLKLWRSRTSQLAFEDTDALLAEDYEFRLQITPREAKPQLRRHGLDDKWTALDFLALRERHDHGAIRMDASSELLWAELREHWKYTEAHDLRLADQGNRRFLARLLNQPGVATRLVSLDEVPLRHADAPLRWTCVDSDGSDYALQLVTAGGEPVSHSLTVLPARPVLYLTDDLVFPGPADWLHTHEIDPRYELPREVVETSQGVDFILRLGATLPERLAARVTDAPMSVVISLKLSEKKSNAEAEFLYAEVAAADAGGQRSEVFDGAWTVTAEAPQGHGQLVRFDRAALRHFPSLLDELALIWDPLNRRFRTKLTKNFPSKFHDWAAALPAGITSSMEGLLATIMDDPLRASVRFEVKNEPGSPDWFDLKVILEVEGLDLSPEELRALVEAKGGYVRMRDGGWRRLEMALQAGQAEAVAHLGLDVFDLSGETHRMHVLQLSDPAARDIFDPNTWENLCHRATALQLSVRPAPPEELKATLRPYQIDGFHFLAYLATNNFGGILADDMGLGKTVQSLCWMLWLRSKSESPAPTLVVCPKSVLDVWAGEVKKFASHLRVQVIRNKDELDIEHVRDHIDVLVLNYAQLRVNHEKLKTIPWLAMILDEGQQIKNPDSQASRAARDVRADNRLVLTGTPIENRLLDIWSLMAYAMPGVLGNRKYFTDRFDRRKDPDAHVRLGARLRPFLLRRTKNQVALDLPPRTEEDVFCKMESDQEELYRAELERIQNILLGFQTDEALRKNSFVVLQGLMRLRQICCHPALLDSKHAEADSAKMQALFYLLDQLKEEGHKVLVFSQFTSMLDIIKNRLIEEKRPYFLLTGQTQNRQEVVSGFQESPDPAVFLLSLKAGGSGLNLTAASYVVLYDPWWNPAVENQAIDRTHRIGQTNPVIAYRLLARNTIEEKIRLLQQQKQALVTGVLGEESFTKNLRLDDLKYLFQRDED